MLAARARWAQRDERPFLPRAFSAAAKDASSDFGKLMREWTAFGDWDPNAPWSNHLYKAVADATIWDPPAE